MKWGRYFEIKGKISAMVNGRVFEQNIFSTLNINWIKNKENNRYSEFLVWSPV